MRNNQRGFIIPDIHAPLHDEKAISVTLKAIDIVKPDTMINLGDVGEWESVSAWRYKSKKLPPLEYQLPLIDEDIQSVNTILDLFDDAFKGEYKYMLEGNHDDWMNKFVEKHPYMKDYTFRKACKLDDRGYKFLSLNRPLKIGKANFIHGAYCNIYHAKRHLDAYGQSIIYGHTHDVQRHTATKLGGTIGSWSMGCLKDMSRDQNTWLRGHLHNWQHAFGIIDWFSNGDFRLDVVEIINGKTVVWGKTVEADKVL